MSKQLTDVWTPMIPRPEFSPSIVVSQKVGGSPPKAAKFTTVTEPWFAFGRKYSPLIATSPGSQDALEIAKGADEPGGCSRLLVLPLTS